MGWVSAKEKHLFAEHGGMLLLGHHLHHGGAGTHYVDTGHTAVTHRTEQSCKGGSLLFDLA
jgi:hypothetical protein